MIVFNVFYIKSCYNRKWKIQWKHIQILFSEFAHKTWKKKIKSNIDLHCCQSFPKYNQHKVCIYTNIHCIQNKAWKCCMIQSEYSLHDLVLLFIENVQM